MSDMGAIKHETFIDGESCDGMSTTDWLRECLDVEPADIKRQEQS